MKVFKNTWQEDYPDFNPDFTPVKMFRQGIFAGGYFRKGVVEDSYSNYIHHHFIIDYIEEFATLAQIHFLFNDKPNIKINKYKVDCGGGYDMWVMRDWIKPQDPFGWVNWYINFYYGRRSEDDQRQINRWIQFKKRHSPRLYSKDFQVCNESENLKTRQNLLHWAIDPLQIQTPIHLIKK